MNALRIVIFIGLFFLCTVVRGQDPLDDEVYKAKILPAMVKIELIFRDNAKRIVGPPVSGQGVRVSSSGHILTSLHVAIPTNTEFSSRNAATYEVRISKFDTDLSGYVPLVLNLPQDIRSVSLYDRSLDGSMIESCSTASTQPCMKGSIDAKSDFVLISTATPAAEFIDIIGPFDLESAVKDLSLGVISDFFSTDIPEFFPAKPTIAIGQNNQEAIFRSGATDLFRKGISGSPLIGWKLDRTSRRGVFVVGIVSSNRPDENVLNRFKATLISSNVNGVILKNLRNDEKFLSSDTATWKCQGATTEFPAPNTLLRDFLLIARAGASGLQTHSSTVACGRQTTGWRDSFTMLRAKLTPGDWEELDGLLEAEHGIRCSGDGDCTLGSGQEVAPYVAVAFKLDETRRAKIEEWKKFQTYGGSYRGGCPAQSNCLAGPVAVGPPNALMARQRALELEKLSRSLEGDVRQARTDALLAGLVIKAQREKLSVDNLLLLYGLTSDGNTEGIDTLGKAVRAIERGNTVNGFSQQTKSMLEANLRSESTP